LIRPIRGRDAFARLSRDGSRIHGTSLWCSFLSDPAEGSPPRVAYSIGRAVGPAVVRNRVRRRLRVLAAEAAAGGRLPSGWLLIGCRPSVVERTFDDLRRDLDSLLDRLPR
jgi:ribonuclease P protein component